MAEGENIILLESVRSILKSIHEDTNREGLKDTPKRYIKFLHEFTNPEPFTFTSFDSEDYDEAITVKDIPFFSLCEHHLVPFFGTAAIGYIPNGRICGLSKLPRCLDNYARRLQNQERITTQVADEIMKVLKPRGAIVTIQARHLCMEMRGIKKHDCQTVTTALRGVYASDASAKDEFFKSLKL